VVSTMRGGWGRTVGLAVLLLASSLAIPLGLPGVGHSSPSIPVAVPPGVSAPPGAGPIEVAPGYSPSGGVREVGPVPNATRFDLAVGLAPRNLAGLDAYLTAAYTPGSVAYHRFLSAGDLAEGYGPSDSAVAQATNYFSADGLSVSVSPDHLLLTVQGPASAVSTAFGTSFEEFSRPAGGWFVSHPDPAELPAGVPWSGVLGLGNSTPLVPAALEATPTPLSGPAASCGPSEDGFAPCQLARAYNFSGLLSEGNDGAGTTIGVVDTYDGTESQNQLTADLADFTTTFDLAPPSVHYEYPVPTTQDLNATSTGWGLEEALDLEWTHAVAPGAAIDMTFAPNSGAGLYEAVDYLVAHQSVNVISLSWGEPDTGIYNAYEGPCPSACNASSDGSYALLSPVLTFAAAEGISVFAATGDCGAADGTSGLATNFPASDPFVTAVGGTTLTVNTTGTWLRETGWSGNASGARAPGCENQGGSGGGFSPFPRPYWQSGPGVPGGDTARATPDVSAVAAPGVAIVHDGAAESVDGTSVATPVWAGITALADQYAGSDLGFLNPTLYSILRGPDYSADFHDITVGNNTYSAGVGWDAVTGIGTPIVSGLVNDLALGPAPSSSLASTLNASTTSGPAPLRVSFYANVTGGSGTYPLRGVYFGNGNASSGSGDVVNYTYTVPGVYPAQSYAADGSGNLTASGPLAIVVGGGGALGAGLHVSNGAPAVDATVTLDATATGGTGPYSYLYWFGDGTYQNWTPAASVGHSYGAAGSFCALVVVRDSGRPINGGTSLPVPVAVGGAPTPTCPSGGGPFSVTAAPSGATRDAPADFPALFHVDGGAGTISEQYVSTDPYVAACECTIFRSAGTYLVRDYVNDSAGGQLVAETNVTVDPSLTATFAASPLYGRAPLTVDFAATASGGDGAAASGTRWEFGNGNSTTGSGADQTYRTPGSYWATAALGDRGDGNASEAFLVDVGPAVPTGSPYVTATVAPVANVSSGQTVEFEARAQGANGTAAAAGYSWNLGEGSAAYSADANRTFEAPASGAAGYAEQGNVTFRLASDAENVTVPFDFGSFFAVEASGFVPRTNALTFSDLGGPDAGAPPVNWSGAATAYGVGSTDLSWTFGDGSVANGTPIATTYSAPGRYTVTLWANDSWGDQAIDSFGVAVGTGGISPLVLDAGPSTESGTAPLTVAFHAVASGGAGGPYSYRWQFGDGVSATEANVSHTYETSATFTANLTVTDVDGDRASRSYSIDVGPLRTGTTALPPGSLAEVALAAGVAVGLGLAAIGGRRSRDRTIP
jgi:PKD repeat protein